MEYAVFVIGIVALIVSVVISGKISKRSEEEIAVLKEELKSLIELSILDKEKVFTKKLDPIYEHINRIVADADDLEADKDNLESAIDDLESKTAELQDQITDIEHSIQSIKNTIDIIAPATPFLEQDYATYLENDASVIKHIDATGYDISETILFMAYMLQDLKDKVYGKKVVTHEEPKTKTSTRRKKVSVSGDTNNTTTGSEASKV